MKRITLFVILITVHSVAYNQVIKGTIYDEETRKPIYSASVYFNGTSAGTLSDEEGNFTLDVLNFKSMPLSISALGYLSVTISEYATDQSILVYMKPKVFTLNEVTVNEKSHAAERKQNMNIFKGVFLGCTDNAFNCAIENEDDIRFTLSPGKDLLSAFAIKPIIIDNKSLGYKITYYLEEFKFNKHDSTFLITGEMTFKDKKDYPLSSRKKISYDKKRAYAYLGSRMHFFRSLWSNNLASSGFELINSENDVLASANLISHTDSLLKYLKYHGSLGIAYNSDRPDSFMNFIRDSIFFDSNGYFQPYGIDWEGEMVEQRIGDMLPYEYLPDK